MIDSHWQWSELAAVWPQVRLGFTVSVLLTLLAIGFGLPTGILLGLATASRLPAARPLAWIIAPLSGLVRSLPALVVLAAFALLLPSGAMWMASILPQGPAAVGGEPAAVRDVVSTTPFAVAAVALALILAVRTEGSIRANARAIDPHLFDLADALGMTPRARLIRVLFPETLHRAWPVVVEQCVRIFRDSTLAAVIGCTEVLAIFMTLAETRPQSTLEAFVLLIAGFLIVTVPLELLLHRLERSRRAVT